MVDKDFFFLKDCNVCGNAYSPTGKYQKKCFNCIEKNHISKKKVVTKK